ncbi:jg3677 [Pararge aegeria aegeria]|uniref:Jg3677 protein n=1 Tax=Pararge aegeria aegeria TaxID=348720 RepID=A0A8S4QV75_9NEOP|nr:jg3677 [Pararge aegeria aegeria]
MSSSKRSPRAMPMETIITRYKSQQKHNNIKQNKNVTKSKSKPKPQEQYVWKQKQTKSLNEENNIIVLDDDREFYPDKPKRNIGCPKIVLKPKYSMKLIGGTKSSNKRKLHMPQKGN